MVFKGCQRCGGDLYNAEQLGQVDQVCLQCGSRSIIHIDFITESRGDQANPMLRARG